MIKKPVKPTLKLPNIYTKTLGTNVASLLWLHWWGVLTDKVYGIRGCSKVLRCIFVCFGTMYIEGWVIVTYLLCPICKIGCILDNLAKKAPNLPQIGCFLQKNGIEMGHKITFFEV